MSQNFITPDAQLEVGTFYRKPYRSRAPVAQGLPRRWRNYIASYDEFNYAVQNLDAKARCGKCNKCLGIPVSYPNCCKNCLESYQYYWNIVAAIVVALNIISVIVLIVKYVK